MSARLFLFSGVVAVALSCGAAGGRLCAGETQGVRPAPASRALSTDRPDATESPFTVDAGRVQVELDFAAYTRDRQGGTRTVEWDVAPFNLRVGLTPRLETGVFIVPHRRVRMTPRGGARETRSGFGDTTWRAKYNFTGNDSGNWGSGMIVDVKLPTGSDELSNGKVEGAMTFPFAFELGRGWGGGAMTSVERVYVDAGRFRTVWTNTITVGRDLTETIGGFVEVTSSAGDGRHVAMFNCGLTRAFGPDLQLDGGVNIGISRTAPDVGLFAGMSRRF